MKRWSLDARSEGQSIHPLVSEQFAHEWEEANKIGHPTKRTSPFHSLRKVLVRRAQSRIDQATLENEIKD